MSTWHRAGEGRDAVTASIRRATINEIDDKGTQQIVKKLRGLASEEFEEVYRAQAHGLSSSPPAGSEAVLLAMSGRSDRAVLLGGEHKDHRPKDLKAGESKLYDHKGNIVYMRGADGVEVRAKEGKVVAVSKSDHVIVYPENDAKKVYLGGDPDKGHNFAKVMTEAGPSKNVWARIP